MDTSHVEITVQPELILLKCFQCIILPHKLYLLTFAITEAGLLEHKKFSFSVCVHMLG